MLTSFLLVLTCFAACDGFSESLNADCVKMEKCKDKILKLLAPKSGDGLMGYVMDDQELNALCTELPNYSSCLKDKLYPCRADWTKDELRSYKSMIEYICSSEAKVLLSDIRSQSCYTDQALYKKTDKKTDDCWTNSFAGKSEYCTKNHDYNECLVQVFKEDCGDKAAQYMKGLVSRNCCGRLDWEF